MTIVVVTIMTMMIIIIFLLMMVVVVLPPTTLMTTLFHVPCRPIDTQLGVLALGKRVGFLEHGAGAI